MTSPLNPLTPIDLLQKNWKEPGLRFARYVTTRPQNVWFRVFKLGRKGPNRVNFCRMGRMSCLAESCHLRTSGNLAHLAHRRPLRWHPALPQQQPKERTVITASRDVPIRAASSRNRWATSSRNQWAASSRNARARSSRNRWAASSRISKTFAAGSALRAYSHSGHYAQRPKPCTIAVGIVTMRLDAR